MPQDPLPQLRVIRDKLRRMDAERADLVDGRNRLIRESVRQHKSERRIAEAAGLHHSTIAKIKRLPTE